ncbi:hypothetical protein GC163_17260 [bacterium]|nr:hypothetical protein [bacterium]
MLPLRMLHNFVPRSIATHHPASRPSIDDSPHRQEDKAFYSAPRWRRLRAMKLRMSPLCECGCGQAAKDVHHIIDRKEAPELAYEISNLQSLTKRCHSRTTRESRFHNGSVG